MNVQTTFIEDLKVIFPDVFKDKRGFFFESWNIKKYSQFGITENFVQDNHSKSSKGILRGLHLQTKNSQAKLVRVVNGAVLDVVVDLRKTSKTFGNYFSIKLSSEENNQLFIPQGFAHGFLTLTEEVDFLYKTSDYYYPEYEETLIWNDKEINIDWGLNNLHPIISDKDLNGKSFEQIKKII